MVAGSSTFDAPDFSLPVRPVWYVRKPGWIRGPYSLEDMRRFRNLGWISKSEAVSRDMQTWESAGQVDELWRNDDTAGTEAGPTLPPGPTASVTNWRYSANGLPSDESVSFATVQILASLGRIHAGDLVWREGWPEWRRAGDVQGLLSGPSEWCSACGGQVSPRDLRCRGCGAGLPGLTPPHAELCMACGVLGIVLFPVFPLWLIATAIGSHDIAEIAKGRMDPKGRNAATFGLRGGIVGGVLFVLSAAVAGIILVVSR